MNIVLFGGNGFIGSNLSEALLSKNHSVRIFDRHHSVRMLPRETQDQIDYFEGDFLNVKDVRAALKGCDVAYHLISSTLPSSSHENPSYDVESNIVPSVNFIKAAADIGINKIIFVSSGGTVYGIPQSTPIPETHPTDPICAYGISKLAIEKYLALYNRLTDINYTIVRLANPFGYYQNPLSAQGVIAVFLHKILHNEPLEIWGDGSVVRDYIWISDATDALIKVIDYHGKHKLFNLGTGAGTSLQEILLLLKDVLRQDIDYKKFPQGRPIDVPVNILDINLIKNELNWQPTTSLRTGILNFLEWMQHHSYD